MQSSWTLPIPCSCTNNIPMPLSSDISIPTSTLHLHHTTSTLQRCFNLEEARKLQVETQTQAASEKWHNEREGRLTASHFGEIVKRRRVTEKYIQGLYYPKPFTSTATGYGTAHEPKAKQRYQNCFPDRHVHDVGLLLQPDLPFLGATPDGIVCDWSDRVAGD